MRVIDKDVPYKMARLSMNLKPATVNESDMNNWSIDIAKDSNKTKYHYETFKYR